MRSGADVQKLDLSSRTATVSPRRMTTTRRFCADDLFRMGPTNMDPLTETVRTRRVNPRRAQTTETQRHADTHPTPAPPRPACAVQHGLLPVVPHAVAGHAHSAGELRRATHGLLCVRRTRSRAAHTRCPMIGAAPRRVAVRRAAPCPTPACAATAAVDTFCHHCRHRKGGGQAQQLARPRVRADRRARVSTDGPGADVHVGAGACVRPHVRGGGGGCTSWVCARIRARRQRQQRRRQPSPLWGASPPDARESVRALPPPPQVQGVLRRPVCEVFQHRRDPHVRRVRLHRVPVRKARLRGDR